MTVRQATYDEIPDILVVLEAARGIMRASGNARQWVDGYPGEQVIRADLAAGAGYVLLDTAVPDGNHAHDGNYVPGSNHVPGGNCVPGVAPEVSKKRLDLGQGIAPSRTQKPLSVPEVPLQNVDLGHLPIPSPSAAPDPAPDSTLDSTLDSTPDSTPDPTLAPNATVAPIFGDAVGANQGANPSAAVTPVPGTNPDATHITASSSCPDPTLALSIASSPIPGPALPTKAERIVGYFAYMPSPEPTYARIYGGAWLDDNLPYHVIHRIASLPSVHGVFAAMLDFCSASEPNIRIDTHSDNHIMQHLLARHGFTLCGTIYLASGSPRLAYQRLLPTATQPAK